MKKLILFLLLGSLFLTSCTNDSFDTADQQTTTTSDASQLINILVEKHQAKNLKQKGTRSLLEVINQIETIALQDPDFLKLVTDNYSTPKATDIEAILTNADSVLTNLNIITGVKGFTNTILNTSKVAELSSLEQTIMQNLNLTAIEKTMLLDVIDLKKQNLTAYGNDDDVWLKKGIIGYLQGAIQTKANAVLNVIIIKTIENQN